MTKALEPSGRGRYARRAPKGSVERVPVYLAPDLIEKLDAQATKEGADSRSEIIRKACREYLRRAAKREQPETTQ